MSKTYAIHNASIARELMRRGFELLEVAPNRKNPQFSVYYFKDGVEFQKTLIEIFDRRNYSRK